MEQNIKGLFYNIGNWEQWCNLYDFLEYTMEPDTIEGLVSETDEQEFKFEVIYILNDYEVNYKLVDGKFELGNTSKKFKNINELIDNQLIIKSIYLQNISLFAKVDITLLFNSLSGDSEKKNEIIIKKLKLYTTHKH